MFDAREERVIITNLTRRGKGIEGDPVRIITEIWQLDGIKIAEIDRWVAEQKGLKGDGRNG